MSFRKNGICFNCDRKQDDKLYYINFFIAFTLILSGGVLPLNLYASGAKDSEVALSFIAIIQAIKITKIGNGGVLCMRCAKKSGMMKKWDNNSAPGPSQEYVKTHDIEIHTK